MYSTVGEVTGYMLQKLDPEAKKHYNTFSLEKEFIDITNIVTVVDNHSKNIVETYGSG